MGLNETRIVGGSARVGEAGRKHAQARLTVVLLAMVFLCAGCASFPPPARSPQVAYAPAQQVPEAYFVYPNTAKATVTPQPQYPSYLEALTAPTPTPEPNAAGRNIRLTEVKRGEQTFWQMGDTNYLITKPMTENSDDKSAIARRAAQMLALAEAAPDTQFYAYFINRGPTCDWYERFNDIKVYDYAQYFLKKLGTYSRVHFGQYEIPDFDYYRETGYKTDIHINYIGSQRVYADVYHMMAENMELAPLREPVETLSFDHLMMVGDMIWPGTLELYEFSEAEMDEFKAYRYELPTYAAYVNDKPVILGLEEEYAAGEIDRTLQAGHQFAYYGGQTGVVRLEFNQPDKPNLLMLSDSQGRPSRLPLASHFNTTLYLDYETSQQLDLREVIEQYDIDVVLLIGQISMFEVWG